MHNYAWLCMIIDNYAWLCIMSSLRFYHERGQIKRWGAVRHVIVSGILMRVFFIFIFSQKTIGLQASGRFMFFWRFFTFFRKTWFDPKVPQKCLGPLWDHPRPIRDQFWTILDQNCLKNYIRKIPIQIT